VPGSQRRLVVDPAGLTMCSGNDAHITIGRDAAVAVQAWPDGRRVVIDCGIGLVVLAMAFRLGYFIIRGR
jgi:hypothetical protein